MIRTLRSSSGACRVLACATLLLGACADGSTSDTPRSVVGNSVGGPLAGIGGAPLAGVGGAAGSVLACPASNLTQPCACADGSMGRQICIETTGWGGCDCGQTASAAGTQDLRGDVMTPPANMDTSVTFEDYVMPKLLEAGDCKPGTYVGTFDCLYVGDLAPDGFQALGVVSFVLSRSANSEVLTIEDGVIDGWGVMFFFAYLSGELSCATAEITGSIDDGFYNPLLKGCSGAMGDMPGVNCIITDKSDPDYVAWDPSLEGVYTGELDPNTDTISGDWTFTPLNIGGSCDGSFSVMLVP